MMHPAVARRAVAPVVMVLALALPGCAGAERAPQRAGAPRFAVTTAAARAAARSDRRPVAGALYDPAANATFIAWAGRDEDNVVQAYDHATQAWSPPVPVGAGHGDSHNYPTLIQAQDGHLLVFRAIHNTRLELARSARPHSATGPWTERVIAEAPDATYPMPVKTADGRIFVFYRETSWRRDRAIPNDTRPVKYVVSRDHGATWRGSESLTGRPFAIGSTDRADNLNEIYLGQLRHEPARDGRPERILLVYTLAGGGPGGHRHDRYHRNVYCAVFDPATLRFSAASGRDLGPQIDDAAQEGHLRVAATPLRPQLWAKSPQYVQLVGALDDGRPFVVWLTVDIWGRLHDHHARWSGREWIVTEPARGLVPLDLERLGSATWRLYAGHRPGARRPYVETWLVGADGTWSPEGVIATGRPVQRAEVIAGFRDPLRVLLTGAASARDVGVADGDVMVAGVR